MTAAYAIGEVGSGPYTVLDLHELPEDGKGHELEDGWLIEVAASSRHNWIARTLARGLEEAIGGANADAIVCDGGEWEVSTPAGVRKPDVFVIPKDVARAAIIDESPKIIPGLEILLVVEVVSPGSGSERTDRVRKVAEYAQLGIPQYWLVEFQPRLSIRQGILDRGAYRWEQAVAAGSEFAAELDADKTISIRFDPAELIDI